MKPLPFTANPLQTRADVQQLVRDLVAPVLPHFSPGRTRVDLAANRALYGDPAGGMEGFARPLWGLAPLAAGGGEFAEWDRWWQGLAAGTDPAHPEFWGRPGDYDQRSVEMAALGFLLRLVPGAWAQMPSEAGGRVAAWLGTINDVRLVDNNWLFFRVLVNLGLREGGHAWSAAQMKADLDRIDAFYLGGGWYADGVSRPPFRDGRRGDYYVPMALHFYALLYARWERGRDPERAARYEERARAFTLDFVHWFAADGSALPFGRSLTYRFVEGAFWGALAYAEIEALPWGVMKGLYLRHLRWWLRQPIFSESGLLTIGYAYPNLVMAESYNSPASPYWALKTFVPLALPAEHPFWRAEEAPLPARAAVRTVAGAGLVLTTVGEARDVVALNAGQPVEDWPRHAPHKYSKFAYSTRFAFCVPVSSATLEEGGFDSMLALSDDQRRYRIREHCCDGEVRDGMAYSRWLPWPDVEVRTWLLASGDGHVRVHRVRTARALWSAECGFAAGYTDRTTLACSAAAAGTAKLRTPLGRSEVTDVAGARRGECVALGANSHLLTSLSAMPVLRGEHAAGEFWLACVVTGGAPGQVTPAADAGFTFECEAAIARLRYQGREWWSVDGDGCGRRAVTVTSAG